MSDKSEREKCLAAAKDLDWTYEAPSGRRQYGKFKCSCGMHITWLHKTPSNPNYYRERAAYMRAVCPGKKGRT